MANFSFLFFSDKHDYIKYIDIVDKKNNLIKWNKNHPNKRIRGSVLFQPKIKNTSYPCLKIFEKKKFSLMNLINFPYFSLGGISMVLNNI